MKKRKPHSQNAMRDNAAQDVRFFLPESIMSRWNPEVHAAATPDDRTINIYDVIGYDYWTGEGMTAKIVSSVLNKAGGDDVTVNINSPGGDFFEGLAIYNMLKEYDGDVTVNIVGMAASAASVIAMAGTTVKIAEAGFLMIHNSWHVCVGNKHDMQERADTLAKFDESMVGVYSKNSTVDSDEIIQMMDDETWISGKDAVEMGFASQLLDSDELDVADDEQSKYNSSLKQVDVALAKSGKTRSERRAIIKDLTSTPGATVKEPAKPCAGDNWTDALASLRKTLTS